MRTYLLLFSLLFAGTLFIISCSKEQAAEKQAKESASETKTERAIPVEALVLKKQIIRQQITLSGIIQPIHKVDIISEVSGKVTKIVKELGEYVTTRDTLAYIDAKIPHSNYIQARAQLLSAQNNLEIAQLNLASDKALFESGDISALTYQNSQLSLKTAKANLLSAKAALTAAKKGYDDTRITSPFAGRISRSHPDLGMMVQPGMAVYQVVDLSTAKMELGLPQDIIGLLKSGSEVQLRVSALNNKLFKGIVKFISPAADERSGTFKAEIHIPNTTRSGIRAGMTAKATLFLSDPEPLIAVPNEALIRHNGDADIYKVKNNVAHIVRVELGNQRGAQTIIRKGLSEGDSIVVVGQKLLGTNSKVWIETVH